MALCHLQPSPRPWCTSASPASLQTTRACLRQPVQRFSPLSVRRSSLHGKSDAAWGKRAAPAAKQPKRRSLQPTSAALWFRQQAVSPGSVAASAVATHAAAILSIPLWQHAARSACIVVASLAVAVTVSRFLIVNSGKLEAGEVSLILVQAALAHLCLPLSLSHCVCHSCLVSVSSHEFALCFSVCLPAGKYYTGCAP